MNTPRDWADEAQICYNESEAGRWWYTWSGL